MLLEVPVVSNIENRIGVGLYTPAEAGLYVRAKARAISRWIHGEGSTERVVRPQIESDERVITFRDLVQALSIRAVRTHANRVSLQMIRDAVKRAEDDFGIEFPLARKHQLFLFSKGIYIKPCDSGDFIGLSKRNIGQTLLKPIVEPFLDELSYGIDGFAESWKPEERGEFSIVLDPHVRFGHPTVSPLNILASSLNDSANAEGSVEAAAEMHDVPIEAVQLAVKYFDSLTGLTAA